MYPGEEKPESLQCIEHCGSSVQRLGTEKGLERKAWASLGKTDGSEFGQGKRVRTVNGSIMSSQSS